MKIFKRSHSVSLKALMATSALLTCLGFAPSAEASNAKTLYSFKNDGIDGTNPEGTLVAGTQGYLLGTTAGGGPNASGVVFKVSAKGVETVLHAFAGAAGEDGYSPRAGLLSMGNGVFYGTTAGGGAIGYGTVFSITQAGAYSIIYSFTGNDDGSNPYGGLIKDKAGNVYGVTKYGGASGPQSAGYGTIYEIAAGGGQSVLYSFTGGDDGGNPSDVLVRDKAGNLYGVATNEGQFHSGVVFELSHKGVYSVLHAFAGGTDGSDPIGGLALDSAGSTLYGTTNRGGAGGIGTIFKIVLGATPVFTTVHSFGGGGDANLPTTALVFDKAGNLYGTTGLGGALDSGSVYKLAPDGTESVVYSFSPVGGIQDGPAAAVLVKGSLAPVLYGTTDSGGVNNKGSVFRLKP
jgi:uncharacterized repeat protein (TIGR03803 family)